MRSIYASINDGARGTVADSLGIADLQWSESGPLEA